MKRINTANGPVAASELGNTLMHAHLTIADPMDEFAKCNTHRILRRRHAGPSGNLR